MPLEPEKSSNSALKVVGRSLLRRLEMPIPSYEKRIINNLENLYREIQTGDVGLIAYVSRDAPRKTLRLEIVGQPIAFELVN